MTREYRTKNEILQEYTLLEIELQHLISMLQTETQTISPDDLDKWSEGMNKVINKLNKLRLDVFEVYQ